MDLPLAPEKVEITQEKLSSSQTESLSSFRPKTESYKSTKLIGTALK